MRIAREIIANPAVAVDCRDKYGLLADLGADASEEIAPIIRYFPYGSRSNPTLPISDGCPFVIKIKALKPNLKLWRGLAQLSELTG